MEGRGRCECPPSYLRTIPGILKIAQIILTILTFAISFGCLWSPYGGGWCEFVGISCFITVTIWLILHLIHCIPQLLLNFLCELISYCVMTIMLFIAGIVAATRADLNWNPSSCKSTIGATAFFAFAAAVACGIDAVLQFMDYRKGNTHHSSSATTTVTTTTTSSSAVKVEY